MNWIALLISVGIIFCFLLIGKFVRSVVATSNNKSNVLTAFLELVIGLTLSVSLYAVIKSNANTILLGFFILVVLYAIYSKKKLVFASKITLFNGQIIVTIIILATVFFLIRGFAFYNDIQNNVPHADFLFYAKIGLQLQHTGVENYNNIHNPLFVNNNYAIPYHYFELWFVALLLEITSLPAVEILFVVISTVFSTILSLGVIGFFETFPIKKIWAKIGLLCLLGVPIWIFNYEGFFLSEKVILASYSFILDSKTLIIGIFFVWSFILLQQKSKHFMFPLLCLPLINILLAPVIFIALPIFLLIRKRHYSSSEIIKIISFFIGFVLFIGIFYVINFSLSDSAGSESLMRKSFHWGLLEKKGIFLLYFLVCNVPLLFIAYYLVKTKNRRFLVCLQSMRELIVLVLLLIIIPIIIRDFFIFQDAHQIISLPMMAYGFLISAIVFISIVFLPKKANLYKYIVAGVFIIVFGVITRKHKQFECNQSLYSEKYITSIINETQSKGTNTIIVFKPHSFYQSQFDFPLENHFLQNITDRFRVINYNVIDYPNQYAKNVYVQSYIKQSPLYNMFKKNGNKELTLKNFIATYNIEYLVFSEGLEIPVFLHSSVKKVYTDVNSKEKFVILNKSI